MPWRGSERAPTRTTARSRKARGGHHAPEQCVQNVQTTPNVRWLYTVRTAYNSAELYETYGYSWTPLAFPGLTSRDADAVRVWQPGQKNVERPPWTMRRMACPQRPHGSPSRS